ncbi:GIY-YIG nuclease family protein [Planctomonas sp. JC2975]|uniref:GIY-YIG nuclease family protein n=1 Tax=Planctomonas sp. JC2975 TaxID=2729626 RepID=UPI0014759CA1|nr:GIY-YIG nuclease family protein [Planctomonas sp. JC2975]NNC13601.1 GIY-YIG nuclease family protein [Planctomonas sp. JC2975]
MTGGGTAEARSEGALGGATSSCVIPGCADAAAAGAPVPLCLHHLALGADWVAREYGVHDMLPTPCPACGARVGIRYPSGWVCSVCEWVYGTSPDGDLPLPRVDVVYYIRFDDRMKIGTSSNLRQRLSQLWHHELVALERGGRSREHARHEQFAPWRLGTSEWFQLAPELAEHADALRAGVDDPWELYARWVSEAIALRG